MSFANFPRAALIVARVAGLSVFALLLILGTAMLFAGAISWLTSSPLSSPVIIGSGVICGLTVWLFVFVFHAKKETTKITIASNEKRVERLQKAMSVLGYDVQLASPEKIVGKPFFGAFLFGGAVQAVLSETDVELTGPKMSLERIRHQLRMETHLGSNWNIQLDNSPPVKEKRLRGVNLKFQILEHHDPAMISEVLESLKQKGATVSCAVNLWGQFEDGVSESEIGVLIAQSLKGKGVAVNMHTKPMPATTKVPANLIPSDPVLRIPVAG